MSDPDLPFSEPLVQDGDVLGNLERAETLEESLDIAAELAGASRRATWLQADFALKFLMKYGGKGSVGALAEVWACQKRWVNTLADVAGAIPAEQRWLEASFDWHHALLEAARRCKMRVSEAIQDWCDKSAADLRAIGKQPAEAKKECSWWDGERCRRGHDGEG